MITESDGFGALLNNGSEIVVSVASPKQVQVLGSEAPLKAIRVHLWKCSREVVSTH